MSVFDSKDDAAAFADKKNSEPLPAGKESRTPFKVYSVKYQGTEKFSVGQAPQPAAYAGAIALGISVELVSGAPTKTVESWLANLSPEEREKAKQYLGAN